MKISLRKLYPSLCDRQKELAVLRQSERGGSQCRNLYTGRDSESEWACPDEIYKIYPVRHTGECFS